MIIAVTLDDVLRDFSMKFMMTYDDSYNKVLTNVDPYDINQYFQGGRKIASFFAENVMELFGFCDEKYPGAMKDFNQLSSLVKEYGHELIIISKENSLSKGASLLFLSRFTCESNKVIFVQKDDEYFNHCDILITTNYKLLKLKNKKSIIKVDTYYNKEYNEGSILTINNIKELLNINTFLENFK